jgi:beta-1,4-mannosyl-glycoprotein beta-1,4-N-acetylglucosaminyltransferase
MRIYDTFLFDGEFELLEHRLSETFDLVDVFVIVEAAQTFRGEPKPLHLAGRRARFAWAQSKLRIVSLSSLGSAHASPWTREALQRDAIMLGLRDAKSDDVVLLFDADEIPSRSLLERLRHDGLDRPRRVMMTRHYEYADQLAPASACCHSRDTPFPFHLGRARPGSWNNLDIVWFCRSGVACRFADLVGDNDRLLPPRSAYDMRRLMLHAPTLRDGGRHLSFNDPTSGTASKLGHVSHAELADARTLHPKQLERTRRYGVHHHGWWYAETPSGPLPEDIARFVARCPGAKRAESQPSAVLRRLARTWSWLRHWPRLGDRVVAAVDGLPDWLIWVVCGLPLLGADALRALAARRGWRLGRDWLSLAEGHGSH